MAQRKFLSDIAKQNVGWGFRAEAVRLRGESRDEVSLLRFTSLGLACIFVGVLEVEAVLGRFMSIYSVLLGMIGEVGVAGSLSTSLGHFLLIEVEDLMARSLVNLEVKVSHKDL
jgi:hypothetical protein